MCTVSYLPHAEGFILTSNRDETPSRRVETIDERKLEDTCLLFPKDPLSGGSWFALSTDGRVACLLNGAYEPLDISIKFPVSRGNVLIESFNFDEPADFVRSSIYAEAAPFTMVMIWGRKFVQLIWDGQVVDLRDLASTQPHFWSSVTLYSQEIRERRADLFDTWCAEHHPFDQAGIIDFHRYGGIGDTENDFVMNRNDIVKTLSITSVAKSEDNFNFRHINLASENAHFHKVIVQQQALGECIE